MVNQYNKKEIAFERVLFFNDAVVAIAITLLALELKVEIPDSEHLSFDDLIAPWHKYLAFLLSFINIAGFWNTHHQFFTHIKKMNEKMLYLNIVWLFFIVTLPFSSSVLSAHFGDTAAICLYSANIFLLSVIQNFIWDYADDKPDFLNYEHLDKLYRKNMRWMLNFDMLNGLVAIVVCFFMPKLAFFLLFFKIPIILFVPILRRKNSSRY